MRSAAVAQSLSSVTSEYFPAESLIILEVPFFEDSQKTGAAFLAAVSGAKPGTCLALQPGSYPPFVARRNVYIRADIPGTVEIIAEKGQPAVVAAAPCVRLEGICLRPAPGEDTAAVVHSGALILEDCKIEGTAATLNPGCRLYLGRCRVHAPGVGVHVSSDSTGIIETSAFLGCTTGISAVEDSRLEVLHCRFQGCGRDTDAGDGTAIRATKAEFYCAGGRFDGNRKGVELQHCKQAALISCVFDSNPHGSLIVNGGASPRLQSLQFWGKVPGGTDHLTLSGVEAAVEHTTFNDVSLHSGISSETELSPASSSPLDRSILQLKKIAVSQEIKGGLEAIFRNAQSALQRVEHGLPVPLQFFHCVFEGEHHLGQHRVAALLANYLKELGFLSTNKLSEVLMDELMLHKRSIDDVAKGANGGALLIQVSRFVNKREAHTFYARAREILEALINACGNSSILILCGERDIIRPILKKSALAEALGNQVVRFAPYVPGELVQVFTKLCEDHQIRVTPRAIEKLLLTFYMLDDRRDKRFARSDGVRSLFEASEKQHRQRCAAKNDYNLPLDDADLKLPLEQNADLLLASQPAFVSICPKCSAQSPWLPGTSDSISHCPGCGHSWECAWGIWKDSTFFRRTTQKEEGAGLLDDIRPIDRRFKR